MFVGRNDSNDSKDMFQIPSAHNMSLAKSLRPMNRYMTRRNLGNLKVCGSKGSAYGICISIRAGGNLYNKSLRYNAHQGIINAKFPNICASQRWTGLTR